MRFLSHDLFAFAYGSALIELDVDMTNTFDDLRCASHGAGTPPPHIRVWPFVDARFADEQLVCVDAWSYNLGVCDGTRDQLLHEGSAGFRGEVEELQGIRRITPANEIDDHPRFARTDPLKSGCCNAYHVDSFLLQTRRPET
jgi:hypothetical protein